MRLRRSKNVARSPMTCDLPEMLPCLERGEEAAGVSEEGICRLELEVTPWWIWSYSGVLLVEVFLLRGVVRARQRVEDPCLNGGRRHEVVAERTHALGLGRTWGKESEKIPSSQLYPLPAFLFPPHSFSASVLIVRHVGP